MHTRRTVNIEGEQRTAYIVNSNETLVRKYTHSYPYGLITQMQGEQLTWVYIGSWVMHVTLQLQMKLNLNVLLWPLPSGGLSTSFALGHLLAASALSFSLPSSIQLHCSMWQPEIEHTFPYTLKIRTQFLPTYPKQIGTQKQIATLFGTAYAR